MINLILLLIGLGLVVLGADWLVNGASSIARRAGISEFVIGLTIVGFGTSCPELVVSLTGAIEGNSDISVGNVVGSNIFNALFILGLTALVLPVGMTDKNRRIDIPITLVVNILLVVLGITGSMSGPVISRWEGVVMLLVFSVYLFYCFKSDSKDELSETQQSNCIDPDRSGRPHLRWGLVRGQRDSPGAADRGERQIYSGHDSRRRYLSAGTCYEPDSGNQGKRAAGAW